jgi:serine/threonine protein kinase
VIANKYRLVDEIGRGGVGVVYVADHVELEHRVAVKFLRVGIDDATTVERFRREARAAARIRSEHVARVSDFGDHDGSPFLVMEYLVGEDLESALATSGPLVMADAVHHVLQTLEALAEAHVQGVVHRDLKPSNLFLATRPDGVRVIKLLDFGISKETHDTSASITGTAGWIGSPRYMSPEQLQMATDLDAGSDIWGLGVTLFELLTGESPFAGGSVPMTCVSILKDEPKSLCELRPELPVGLERVILRCLEKTRAERWANVAELAVALRPFGTPGIVDISIERIVDLHASQAGDPVDEIESRIEQVGGRTAIPRQAMSARELTTLELDHRAGFLLAIIDGQLTVDDLLDISGMAPLETMRLLGGLIDCGAIAT